MTTVLDAQARRQLQRALMAWRNGRLGCYSAMELAVEAPIANQTTIRTPPEQQVEKIDSAKVRPSQGLLFIARRAGKMRVRHGSNFPKKVNLRRNEPNGYEGNLSRITFVRKLLDER